MSNGDVGIDLIAAERRRQLEQEGYTSEHDDREHTPNEFYNAALAYSYSANEQLAGKLPNTETPALWPFGSEAWKPKSVLRDLVRAGALYMAAIDMLKRRGELERNSAGARNVAHYRALMNGCAYQIEQVLAKELSEKRMSGK